MNSLILFKRRIGCKDIWNAFMCKDAVFSERDITFCPTILSANPKRIITWEEARVVYKKEYAKNHEFKIDAFV